MNRPLTLVLKLTLVAILVGGGLVPGFAQEGETAKPPELQVVKDSIGIWDAAITVWAAGPEADPITMKGVETNRAFGEHWLASDFESEFNGQTMTVHSIVGYDLDEKKLVGKVIDYGPYMARMTGEYDPKTKTVTWTTKVKDPAGKPIVQKTTITRETPAKRVLVLSTPGETEGAFTKFMRIVYTKRR